MEIRCNSTGYICSLRDRHGFFCGDSDYFLGQCTSYNTGLKEEDTNIGLTFRENTQIEHTIVINNWTGTLLLFSLKKL